MRRTLAEWLLLPLFLLPLAAGAGFCLLARQRHAAEVAEYREDGARILADRLAEGAGREIVQAFLDRHAPEPHPPGPHPSTDFFRHPQGQGLLHLGEPPRWSDGWDLEGSFPTGLLAGALADASVRLVVETGTSLADVMSMWADPGTTSFAELVGVRNLRMLRYSPLTAATKLYLVRRWLRDEPDSVEFRAAERSLLALRDYQRAVARHGGALPPGRHRSGDALVLVSGGEWPDQVFAAGAEWPGDTWSTDLADPPVTLRYGPPPTGAAAVAWQGRLEEPLAGDWAIVLPHGDRWWMDPRFRRWAGPAGAALAGFLLIPAALLISIRRRRRLDDARARFINELAHDLRTPLTSLRLYAEMLSAGKVGEEDRGRYVDTMARESARVSGLLANLLDLSRLERGKRVFETSRIELDEAVEAAARDFAALYPDRADDLRIRGSDDMGVRGDRTALARCLANLLDNAGKFTAPGTPIRISWDMADEGVVRLVVSDEGPGIPRAERKKLFARYVRGSAAAAGVPGTGLGLSLVRELIEGMGGSARFARAERGIAVELRLPGGVDG